MLVLDLETSVLLALKSLLVLEGTLLVLLVSFHQFGDILENGNYEGGALLGLRGKRFKKENFLQIKGIKGRNLQQSHGSSYQRDGPP